MTAPANNTATQWLLNLGHAIDHMFLLIFATAVTSIAADFGLARWEDLMPYSVGAFLLFGIGSLPAGRLGDQWGRRPMMVVFFVGIGAASLLCSITQSPMQLALALTLVGAFASIYHPVGIPMLVQGALRPGWTIGINGLAGNLGIACAAVTTGFLVKYFGWRMAFAVPGVLSIACGVLFAFAAQEETVAPARRKPKQAVATGASMVRILLVMTIAATMGSFLFNVSTNANYELLTDRLRPLLQDPAWIGALLALTYSIAALTQVLVGYLLDRMELKHLYLAVTGSQLVLLAIAAAVDGWAFFAMQLLFMAAIFGAVPFTDAMIVRYVDDSMRSRVSGIRLAVALGASSAAVWLIGPIVRGSGFTTLLVAMAVVALLTMLVVARLPLAQAAPGEPPPEAEPATGAVAR